MSIRERSPTIFRFFQHLNDFPFVRFLFCLAAFRPSEGGKPQFPPEDHPSQQRADAARPGHQPRGRGEAHRLRQRRLPLRRHHPLWRAAQVRTAWFIGTFYSPAAVNAQTPAVFVLLLDLIIIPCHLTQHICIARQMLLVAGTYYCERALQRVCSSLSKAVLWHKEEVEQDEDVKKSTVLFKATFACKTIGGSSFIRGVVCSKGSGLFPLNESVISYSVGGNWLWCVRRLLYALTSMWWHPACY